MAGGDSSDLPYLTTIYSFLVYLPTLQIYTMSYIDREDMDEDRTFFNFFHRLEQLCDKALLPPAHYKLQYDFPDSPLLMNADFGDHDQVMMAFDKFATLPKKKVRRGRISLSLLSKSMHRR